MKLSVIVPVYNVEKYLRQCVDSILGQTLRELELILVDDGASDGSGAICDEYAGADPERVKVLHIDNGGQGRARNFALDIMQGDYVGFIDSDDWIDPGMYEKLVDKATETGADAVFCDFMAKYADGREEYLRACCQEHRLSSAGSCCNKIFRRGLIGDVRFPSGLWYEDFYFSARMLMKSKHSEYIREPLYLYRIGQPSTMHNNNAGKNLDMLTVLNMLEGHMEREDFEFFVVNHVILDSISRVAKQSSPDREEVIRALRDYAHRKIPDLNKCAAFRNESLARRTIMTLNYTGMEKLGQTVLNIKARL